MTWPHFNAVRLHLMSQKMSQRNTFNICVGHVNFPLQFSHYIDLMLAPKHIDCLPKLFIVEDSLFGANGHSLSEYVQLLWLMKYIDEVAPESEYIRIFQYRRFISSHRPLDARLSSNESWTFMSRVQDLGKYELDFQRLSTSELFNEPVEFPRGVAGHYAECHKLDDYIDFSKYLFENEILSSTEVAEFIQQSRLIPSSSMGVFRKDNLKFVFRVMEKAAHFIDSPLFKARVGYQRRTAGFLLERLQSYLVLKRIEAGSSTANFGSNIVISEENHVRNSL